MTVAKTQPTMTEGQKADAFDKWLELVEASNPGFAEAVEVGKGSAWFPAEAIAHAIADRKPDLAPWTPDVNDRFYSTGWRGEVVPADWTGDVMDTEARDFGNVFRTREDAEAHAARLRVFNRICQMMLALDWAPPYDSEVYRAMREYQTSGDTAGVMEFDAIREQLGKEGTL